MSALLFFLPDWAIPTLIVVLAVGMILRLVRARTVMAIVAILFLGVLLGPVIEHLFAGLPAWLCLLVLVILAGSLIRALFSAVLGRRAADMMVGVLAADLVRLGIRTLFFPLRLVGWGLRGLFRNAVHR